MFALIAEYVATGKAVSSTQVAKVVTLKCSPATIRRDLQVLAEAGYVIQPHTSAGRIPTDQAFRFFVDTVKQETSQLHEGQFNTAIFKRFKSLGVTGQESWQDIVRTLSDFVYQAALVVTPSFAEAILSQLKFIACGPASLLAVIVTREGLVHNAFVKPRAPVTEGELERIHNYLNDAIAGRTLNEVRAILRAELEDARQKCDLIREKATLLGSEALASGIENRSELVVEGRSHLAAQPELRNRLKELMLFLEEKSRILKLLDQAVGTSQGPIVIIGQEGGESFEGCAMISAPFGDAASQGQIGILGSSRMDYRMVIPLVNLAAKLLTRKVTDDSD
jgi:heat-inducible transcriptional repressor